MWTINSAKELCLQEPRLPATDNLDRPERDCEVRSGRDGCMVIARQSPNHRVFEFESRVSQLPQQKTYRMGYR